VGSELTAVEAIKRESRGLRGALALDLERDAPGVSPESEQLLKFHGIYAQDDRDVRRARTQAGEDLEYIFMVRVVVPGGRLDARQWLALDEVATTLTDGSIRLTTRQAVQLHAVRKGDLRPLARRIDDALLSSFGGCGDVVRNVVACPELSASPAGALAARLRDAFRSTSSAYLEVFVDGELAASRAPREERPFYGEAYLPRKFKIAIAHPEEN
jgi:sulfite reductase (ferredoxin)